MASTKPGHVALGSLELVIQDDTYRKQLQTPFSSRFATGDNQVGDLSFFQYFEIKDFSGGSGQEVFVVQNRFQDGENIDVTEANELKLAPLITHVADVNGPQHEHLNRPVEEEDGWPQLIEWQGQAIIYNDRIEYDAGGTEFLEVYETDVTQDQVIGNDPSGTGGNITNDTRATILSISKVQGLPGETILVKVRFSNPQFAFPANAVNGAPYGGHGGLYLKNYDSGIAGITPKGKVAFRLYFGGDAEKQSAIFSEQIIEYEGAIFTFTGSSASTLRVQELTRHGTLNDVVDVDFTLRIPEKAPGIYKLWTDVGLAGYPFEAATVPASFQTTADQMAAHLNTAGSDTSANANVLFFIQSVDEVLVTRKNLYAPQLKAAAIIGEYLVGGRVFDGVGYLEVYAKQNEAVDRILQLKLTDASVEPTAPTYMQFIGSNDVVIAAFDNRIYAVDILTSGLTVPQRFTFIGQVPGDYVSGMALFNQRIYILSVSKSNFTSTISWTNGTELQGSYAIDGKFWGTELCNFNGGLFYAGGTQDGVGHVRLFPAETVITLDHPTFDSRVRSLNAGRRMYFGHSHGTGVGTITERGVSKWAQKDLGEEATNVVWDIEEVGDTVFFLAGSALYKTTSRYASSGFWESSRIGRNTTLIPKIWSSITIETAPLNAAHTIRVLVRSSRTADEQWTMLGTMTSVDGITKEFFLPAEYQANWIEIRLEIETSDDTTSPIIKSVLTKFVPDKLNKLQWAFAIRATDGLKMLDGTTFPLDGNSLINAIWSQREIGIVRFRDLDGSVYNAIITDILQTTPLIDQKRQEALISVELLEA